MTDEKLNAIMEYARTLPNPIFVMDVEQLVEEVKRLRGIIERARAKAGDVAAAIDAIEEP
jgi:hypothetical protein